MSLLSPSATTATPQQHSFLHFKFTCESTHKQLWLPKSKAAQLAVCSINTADLNNDWPQLLKFSIASRDLMLGSAIHAFLVKSASQNDAFQGNNLINMYVKLNRLNDAQRVFDEMPMRNTVTWTSLMNGYAQVKDAESVFRIAHDMCYSGDDFTEQTYTVLLQACGSCRGVQILGEQIHGLAIKRMIDTNIFVGTSLMSMYSNNNLLGEAEKVFNNLGDYTDIQCFNTMVVLYVKNGDCKSAVRVLCDMLKSGLEPNEYTFTSIISACTRKSRDVQQGMQLQGLAIKYGHASVTSVGNAIITMYGKNGFTDEARKMFCRMGSTNLVTWTALLSGYVKNGESKAAMSLFVEMLDLRIGLDSSCLTTVIDGCSECQDFSLGLQLHGLVTKLGYISDVCVLTALIHMHAKYDNLSSARLLFNSSQCQTIVSLNAMLLGDEEEDSMNLLTKLRSSGQQPDAITFSKLISLSGNQACMAKGQSLHAYAIKLGFEQELIVSNPLISMYAKCGSITDACAVFDYLMTHDVVTWNAMISAYALHGQGKRALCLFEEMRREVEPDKMTVVAVLQACNYSGLFEKGFGLFEEMESKYGIKPVLEHCACMVDLLGRAGHLAKAMDFVLSSPFTESTLLWRSLVNACRLNGDLSFGRVASRHLLKMVSEDAASHILVSNMYAANGLFNEAAEARKMAHDQKLTKEAGYSWIEIDNRVHRFVASGRDHPASREIYMNLNVLTAQTRERMDTEMGPNSENSVS